MSVTIQQTPEQIEVRRVSFHHWLNTRYNNAPVGHAGFWWRMLETNLHRANIEIAKAEKKKE